VKKLVNVAEVEGEGLVALMGETITVMCLNYFYTGKLVGVNDSCILLQDPKIVYETGSWTDKDWSDVQALPCKEYYIQISAIESFGVLK
jgi:hypothetical protein